MNTIENIDIVVCDENVLGFVFETHPDQIYMMVTSTIKGAGHLRDGEFRSKKLFKAIREATSKDLHEFRLEETQYNSENYGQRYNYARSN